MSACVVLILAECATVTVLDVCFSILLDMTYFAVLFFFVTLTL